MTRALGRIYKPDQRDTLYPMCLVLDQHIPGELPTRKMHSFRGPVLGQGQTGECLGHGWEHFLRTAPDPRRR